MGFEESMTAFYMGFAEDKLDQVCQALGDMRLAVQHDGQSDGAAASSDEAAVRKEMLQACEQKASGLRTSALEQLQHACSPAGGRDVDAVLSAFYLCASLGAANEGVSRFAACLGQIFSTQAQASLEHVQASKRAAKVNEHGYIDRAFYVEALSGLMTGATDIMNAVADVTADVDVLRRVLGPIHATCAEISLEMVRMYAGDARMAAWERRAQAQAQRHTEDHEQIEADESLQMMDLFLDELAFIIRVIVSYCAFLSTVCDGLEAAGSSFQTKVQELSGVYLVIERFYVFQSVHKATAIAEPQELQHGVFVSSVVEDVSFVLNKAFHRASQCMSYHTALSIVIALVDALESQYLPAILALPSRPCVIPLPATDMESASASPSKEGPGASGLDASDEHKAAEVSFSDMLLQAVDDDLTQSLQEEAKLIMTINSAFLSGEFVRALEDKIDEFSRLNFPHEAAITECLPTPIHDMSEAFRSIVANEVQEVLSRTLRKRLPHVIQHQMEDEFTYVLSSAQYDACDSQGSPLQRLLEKEVMVNRELRHYEAALCRTPFEDLVEALAQDLTAWLERALLATRKPFNDLGALQLEREVTDMLTRVGSLVPDKSVRGAFTRLFQVVLILNLMQPAHVLDYLTSVREELSLKDIAALLHMRMDFKAPDVARAVDQMKKADVQPGAKTSS